MIGLASRLTAGSGREALVRLLLTGVGLALAVIMLLFAAVAFPALHSHDVRRAWTETSEDNRQPLQDENTTDPLLWRLTETRFDGRDLMRVDMAATGPDAPVPPGLGEPPGPGEIAVSPALGELLDGTDPALLADRFPGEVTATVGRDALASPDDLVVFVGRSATDLGAETDVLTVRSIEAAPISHNLTRIMRLVVVVGGVGLLAPVIVFVATATRLAAARRERRLAAMRLAGATQRQIGVVAAVEAAIAAVAGTAVGFSLFFAIRPWLARIPFDGARFYTSDLRLSWGWAVAIALGVPALAAAAAVVSLRRLRVSALGVARQAIRARPTPRPLLLVAVGMVGLVLVQATMQRAADEVIALAVGGAFVLMIAGIVLSGPWLTAMVARGVGRLSRRIPALLAARRLEDNPTAGFRAISGIVLAVFVGTVFSALGSSILSAQRVQADGMAPGVVAAALSPQLTAGPPPSDHGGRRAGPPDPSEWQWPHVEPDVMAQVVDDVGALPGVPQVVTAHALPDDPDVTSALAASDTGRQPNDAAVSCADAAAIGFEPCEGTTVLTMGNNVTPTGVTIDDALPSGAPDHLPVVAVAAVTDGRTSTIESARTQLELGLPGRPAVTQHDIDAETLASARTTQRVSNIALSVTLVIAGCSLAVAVAGTIVERRQPFALLRLAGTRLSELRRVVLAEAAAPLLMVATASVGLGLAVTALALETDSRNPPFTLPGASYWFALLGGIAAALLVVLATMPVLNRLTSLDATRFE